MAQLDEPHKPPRRDTPTTKSSRSERGDVLVAVAAASLRQLA